MELILVVNILSCKSIIFIDIYTYFHKLIHIFALVQNYSKLLKLVYDIFLALLTLTQWTFYI